MQKVYLHHKHLLLIQVENTFEGKIQEKNHIFQSSKRPGNGVGIQSVRHIAEKNGGDSSFTYENGVFTAKIMLRIQKTAVLIYKQSREVSCRHTLERI